MMIGQEDPKFARSLAFPVCGVHLKLFSIICDDDDKSTNERKIPLNSFHLLEKGWKTVVVVSLHVCLCLCVIETRTRSLKKTRCLVFP